MAKQCSNCVLMTTTVYYEGGGSDDYIVKVIEDGTWEDAYDVATISALIQNGTIVGRETIIHTLCPVCNKTI